MRILHASDLHLGKPFHSVSRIEQQRSVCGQIACIADERKCDIVLLAGDIFDTPNPPVEAERLYFDFLDLLTRNRNRAVVVIAGNHDSVHKIESPAAILRDRGIFVFGSPSIQFDESGTNPFEWSLRDGILNLWIRGERISLIPLPFASEHRMGKILSGFSNQLDEADAFSKLIRKEVFDRASRLDRNGFTVLIAHQHFTGNLGDSTERDVSLGGTFAVDASGFDECFDYIAAGHLHRPQKIAKSSKGRYSGSPISFEFEDSSISRGVQFIELGAEPQFIELHDPCPPRKWRSANFDQLLSDLSLPQNASFFLHIQYSGMLDKEQQQQLHKAHPRLLTIECIGLNEGEKVVDELMAKRLTMGEFEVFRAFYESRKKSAPSDRLLEILGEILDFQKPEGDA